MQMEMGEGRMGWERIGMKDGWEGKLGPVHLGHSSTISSPFPFMSHGSA